MNWKFEYINDGDYVRITDEGVFNIEDHRRKMKELASQDFWDPGVNLLFDCTKLDFGKTEYQDIRDLALEFANQNELIGCGKIAILMKSIADFGKGRQFELLTDEKICANVSIFIDEGQALRWLE